MTSSHRTDLQINTLAVSDARGISEAEHCCAKAVAPASMSNQMSLHIMWGAFACILHGILKTSGRCCLRHSRRNHVSHSAAVAAICIWRSVFVAIVPAPVFAAAAVAASAIYAVISQQ